MLKQISFLATIGFLIVSIEARGQSHPYLLFSQSDLPAIQARAHAQGTPAYAIWNDLILGMQANRFLTEQRGRELLDPNNWIEDKIASLALAALIEPNPTPYIAQVRRLLWQGYPQSPLGPAVVGMLFQDPCAATNYWNKAHQVIGLSLVYDLLYNEFSDQELVDIKTAIRAKIFSCGLRDYDYWPWASDYGNNQFSIRGTALGIAALALYGDPIYPEAASDLNHLRSRLLLADDSMLRRCFSDGRPAEGVYYGMATLMSCFTFAHTLGRWDNVDYFHHPAVEPILRAVPDELAYEVSPEPRYGWNRYFNNINDSYDNFGRSSGFFAPLLTITGTYQSGVGQWVFQNTVATIPNILSDPGVEYQRRCGTEALFLAFLNYNGVMSTDPSAILPKTKLFREGGLLYMRTSSPWATQDDIQFALEGHRLVNPTTGYFTWGHDQSDKNHFTLYAYGQDFVIDHGYTIGYAEEHNYIMIDGRGQANNPYFTLGVPYYALVSSETLFVRSSSSMDFVHGNAKQAFQHLYVPGDICSNPPSWPYCLRGTGDPPYQDFVNPVERADRYVDFIREQNGLPAYLIMADDIQKDQSPHEYRWRVHTRGWINNCSANPIVIQGNEDANNRLFIYYHDSSAPAAGTCAPVTFNYVNEVTGLSPLPPPSTLQQCDITRAGVVNPYFHTLLFPHKPGLPSPGSVSYLTATNGSIIQADWAAHSDFSTFKHSGNVASTVVSTDAKLSLIRRRNSDSKVVMFSASKGSQLNFFGNELSNLFGTIGIVFYANDTVKIYASPTHFRVYAPNAVSVKFNDVAVPFVQVGDYVEPANVTITRTWDGEISTSSTITVASGVSLTLQPGSNLHFDNGTQLIAYGSLTALGTDQQLIRFVKSSGASNWLGIHVESGLSVSELRHCLITDAITGVSVNSSRFKLKESAISDCSVGIDLSGYHPKLYYQVNTNTVQNCWTSGVAINNADNVTLRDNTISGCTAGLVTTHSTVRLYRNVIENSSEEGVFAGENSNPRFGDVLLADPGNNVIRGSGIAALHAVSSTPFLGVGCERVYGGWNSVYGDALLVHAEKGAYVTANWNWWGFDPPKEEQFLAQDATIDYDCWMPYDPNEGMRPTGSPGLISGYKGGDDPPPILSITPEGVKLRQALVLRAQGEYRRALVVYANLIRTSPNVPEARIALSEARNTFYDFIHASNDTTLRGVLEDSLRAYRNVHPNAMVRRLAKVFLATETVNRRDFALAITEYQQLLQSATTNLERTICLFALFNIDAQGTRNRSEAERYLTQLQTLAPRDIRTRIASARFASMIEAEGGNGMQRPSVSAGLEAVASLPTEFALLQNYPNPFNPSTTIGYHLPFDAHVTLKVYDVLGREVFTLADEQKEAGYHSTLFDATNVSSGIYFYRIQAGSFSQTKKLILLR